MTGGWPGLSESMMMSNEVKTPPCLSKERGDKGGAPAYSFEGLAGAPHQSGEPNAVCL